MLRILTGDEGWCRYAIGAPEYAHVLLHWNNPAAGDNTGDVRIAFPSGQTRQDGTVVDFKRDRKEETPVRFVLRDAVEGGGDVHTRVTI